MIKDYDIFANITFLQKLIGIAKDTEKMRIFCEVSLRLQDELQEDETLIFVEDENEFRITK